MANSRAKARIEARILERAAYCVEFELNDPRSAFITVTGCEVTPDLSIATIKFSVFGTAGEKSKATHMLTDATGFVRRQLGRVLRTRRIPRVVWVYDDEQEVQAHMDQAISEAIEGDRKVNPEAHSRTEPEEKAKPEEADEEA
jgi:ribosome-binding factor A